MQVFCRIEFHKWQDALSLFIDAAPKVVSSKRGPNGTWRPLQITPNPKEEWRDAHFGSASASAQDILIWVSHSRHFTEGENGVNIFFDMYKRPARPKKTASSFRRKIINSEFLWGLGNFQCQIKRLLQKEVNKFIVIVLHTTFEGGTENWWI